MTKNRLVTFGCSLTYGQYLDNPKQQSWPSLLAEKLNLDVKNMGYPGSSNKRIWWNIVNFEYKPSDLICVLWSHIDRWAIIKEDKPIIDLHQWRTKTDTVSSLYFEHFHDLYDLTVSFWLMANHAKDFLDFKGLTNYQINASQVNYDFDWNNIKFPNIKMDQLREKYPKANDGNHPGPLAHLEFANQMYDVIKVDSQPNE